MKMTAALDVKPCNGFSGRPLTGEMLDCDGLAVLLRVLFAEKQKQQYITHRRARACERG